MSDIHIKKFWAVLSRYRAAQASILELQAQEKTTDMEMDDAAAKMQQAIHDVLDTPIGTSHQFMPKFEIVEELITQEDLVGKSRLNYPILVKARAVKLIHMDDELIEFGDATDELLAASILNELLALSA